MYLSVPYLRYLPTYLIHYALCKRIHVAHVCMQVCIPLYMYIYARDITIACCLLSTMIDLFHLFS